MRRTARVSSKPRTAPDQSAPPSSGPDTEFWQGDTSAPPDAQWLRTLDAPAHDGDPAFDLAAPQAPITELLPEAPAAPAAPDFVAPPVPDTVAAVPELAPEPVVPEPVAELPRVSPFAPPPPVPEVATTAPPAVASFVAAPEPTPEPVAEAWVAADAYAPVPVESTGGSWVAAVAPEPAPTTPSDTWTVAAPAALVAGVDDEWVAPGAVVDPAPARAAAPLDLPVPEAPVAPPVPESPVMIDVVPPPPAPPEPAAADAVEPVAVETMAVTPADLGLEPAAEVPVDDVPADGSRRARRARRSLFGYAKRDAEPEPGMEPVAPVDAVEPGAPVPAAGWSSTPVPTAMDEPVVPAVPWTPPEPVAEPVAEPTVEWTPSAPVATEPEPAVEWAPAPVTAPAEVETPFYETEAYEAMAELVPERAPEGSSVTDWLQPANDDLLPQF